MSSSTDGASGEKSKPPPATDSAPTEKVEGNKESAGSNPAQKPAPTSGRKKIRSAVMGLMSLMSPKDKSSDDGKKEDEEGGKKLEATDAATDDAQKNDDDAPPQLPPVNHLALNNSFPMQPANFVHNTEAGNGGYGDRSGGSNRILYPPPNMMDMPSYPPLNIPGPSNPSSNNGGKSFPEILYEIVSNPNYQDIISWLSHGQGFQIHNKQLFAKRLLPEYFDGAKFTSFTRRLKRWSFVRVSRGPELGAYYNKNFVRNQPELVQLMRYRLKEEGGSAVLPNGGIVPQGFLNDHNGGKKRELPDERGVTSTIGSMRQVHVGILPQMPNQAWSGAAMYGYDGFPQLPKPSQLPKRGRHSNPNDGKDNDSGGDRVDVRGTETPSSPPEKKKSKNEDDIMYNHSSILPNSYGAHMQFQHGMINTMQSGMMICNSNMMGFPNAVNNEEQQNDMPKQMMMSTTQVGMGKEGTINYMGSGPNEPGVGSLDTGRGNVGHGGITYCMPTDMSQGNMNSTTAQSSAVGEATEI
mmetsp:Transcript_13841/g.22673  ORF Transcript_13841/g.22673 Transcript_13841/m.22673 type:complete len:523 (+) Transcript_13841:70-1638(+)